MFSEISSNQATEDLDDQAQRVLAIGAHPDDIELGCGATLLAHRARGDKVSMLVMTAGERGPQDARSRVREQEEAAAMLGADLFWGEFLDGAVPEGREGVTVVETVMGITQADVIYVHCPNDSHQDHRATSAVTMGAARHARQILFYASPSTYRFEPTHFIDVGGLVEGKVDLLRCHMSQVMKSGMVDLEAVEAEARYRGHQARARFAEAFEAHRFAMRLSPRANRAALGGAEVVSLDRAS